MLFRLIMPMITLLVLFFSSMPAYCDTTNLIHEQWKFQHGDDPQWASPNFNDQPWGMMTVPSILPQQHGKDTIGWYRVHFDSNTTTQQPNALLIEYIRHADETWLNGKKIGGEGKFEKPWQFINTNPQGLTRLYPIPEGLLKAKNNVLAIKTSIGFGQAWGAMFPGGAGIIAGNVYVGNLKTLQQKQQKDVITTASIDTLFLTLSLIDLLIIIFLLRHTLTNTHELKWLIITSAFMMIGAAGHDFFYLNGLEIHLNLLLFIALAGTPISMAMYFWSQYRNLSQRHMTFIFIIWLFATCTVLSPIFADGFKVAAWYTLSVLISGCFLYSFFCVYKGIRSQRSGSIAQLIALICYLILIRTQWLPDIFLGHRNIQLGSVIYRFALLFAYFQQISSVQLHYKHLLIKMVNIVDEVRNSIARDLHDGIGQHLAVIKLHGQLASKQPTPEHLNKITLAINDSLVELRSIIHGLRPAKIYETSISDAIIKECVHLSEVHTIVIEANIEHVNLNKNMETHIFRMFQESISNSIKHGKPTKINVDLEQKGNQVCLEIKDDGQGFDTLEAKGSSENHGFGFISLTERVTLLDGQLTINSSHGKGTQLRITIPIQC